MTISIVLGSGTFSIVEWQFSQWVFGITANDGTMDIDRISRCTRINVVGTAGSGKSTFARQLGEVLGLPYIEMDTLFWQPDWQETPDPELFPKIRDATSGDRWILDGNYTRSTPEKWKRVELVIWLDLLFLTTVSRVTKRCIQRSFSQRELWPGTGNRESWRKSFLSTDSVIWWSITSHRKNREHYSRCLSAPEYSHISFLRLTTPRMVAECLDEFRQAANAERNSRAS
ncbi:MAG: adenylate kinase [Planctomycetaceae bacterium]